MFFQTSYIAHVFLYPHQVSLKTKKLLKSPNEKKNIGICNRPMSSLITSNRFQKYRIRCCIKAAVVERAKYEKPENLKLIISK